MSREPEINERLIQLSFVYANAYQKNGTAFIVSFIKYPSIRMACESIVAEYKKSGALDDCRKLGKDFTEYASKQPVDERWKPILANMLLIIYGIIHAKD